jgi:uncharacterized protein YjbI with pentapeptide repeats/uncharacterized RDD family membrane protein YckC
MATPIVRRSNNQSSQSKEPRKFNLLPLGTRRFAAWTVEMTLVVVSGLLPYSMGVYANQRSDLNRVPLNPVLLVAERAIARPLALPVSYGIRNVAWPTNFLWTVAILAPLTLSGWQLYLSAKTGSTTPKNWFNIRLVNAEGSPPGLKAVLLREVIGRWSLPVSVAYILWRYSFAFPNLWVFTGLTGIVLLLEATAFKWHKSRRALHDLLAGTYTINADEPFTPWSLVDRNQTQSNWSTKDEEAVIASIVMTPEPNQHPNLQQRIQQNPNLTLFFVASASMVGVLVTLVGTQIYIQTQENQRANEQRNSQQFLSLVKQLNPSSGATTTERQTAILAMGTLNDAQAIQYLVNLLVKETEPTLIDTIEQALVSIGPKAIPDLKQMNQVLTGKLQTVSSSASQEQELQQRQLHATQRVINKILGVYSSKIQDIDLSNVNLGQSNSRVSSFNLVLEKLDLWGIKFKGATLNKASFAGSRFRGAGEDGRLDTFDDWSADLSQAQMKQANFSDANLSRVVMNFSDLSRANLNKANLSSARLFGANLSSAQLVGTDLSGAVLENASLTGADLGEAKLTEANLYAARLGRVIAIAARLSFANLTKTDWQSSDLSGAYLDFANLSGANLSATRLTGAVLRSANLENVNLRNADLSLADLRGANLTGADFQGTILTPGKPDPTDEFVQTPEIGAESAVVKNVDFTQVKNLDPKQIAYICTQGGFHPRCP